MDNKTKLKQMGLTDERGNTIEKYYYIRFGSGKDSKEGRATVCILPYPEGDGLVYVRGVSICNPKDQFCKRTGRAKALGRALKAIEHQKSSEDTPTSPPCNIFRAYPFYWIYLSVYGAALNSVESHFYCSEEERLRDAREARAEAMKEEVLLKTRNME